MIRKQVTPATELPRGLPGKMCLMTGVAQFAALVKMSLKKCKLFSFNTTFPDWEGGVLFVVS